AMHARRIRRPGAVRPLRQAASLPDPISARCALEPGCLSRRNAGLDHQADHGRCVPVRSGGRRGLVVRRTRRARPRADGATVDGKLGAPFRMRPVTQLDVARVRQCAAGPDGQRLSKDDWVKCKGAAVVDVVAEGWGQGHARASALGTAGMMAMLAAAANGQTQVSKPHLVQALRGAGPADAQTLRWSLANAEPNRLARDAAEVIISGLSFSHRAGTAR